MLKPSTSLKFNTLFPPTGTKVLGILVIFRQSPIFSLLTETRFSQLMQIYQLFIVLRQPVTISVTVFSKPTKLTKLSFYLPFLKLNRSLAKQMM